MQKPKLQLKFKNLKPSAFIFFLFAFGFTTPALAAKLYFEPQLQTVYQGEYFIVEVRIDTEGETVNAVEAELSFPPSLLEAVDFIKGNSILTIWPKEPEIQSGSIKFLGGASKGFSGDGILAKITFLAKEIGKSKINFEENSKILLDDGRGTLAKINFLEGNYEIIEKPQNLPTIYSKSHPDQNKWYQNSKLSLEWKLTEGAQYSYLLSQDPLAEPRDIATNTMGDIEYQKLEDGIYYFLLKQKLPGEDWSEKISFRAMIDRKPPEEFKPKISQDASMFGGKYFLSFLTSDKTSGIDYYEVKEGKREFTKTASPYLLLDQNLQSKILVGAVDKAGNERITEIKPLRRPFPYLIIILILVVTGIGFWIIKRKKKNAK